MRETMRRLEQKCIVEHMPNRGAVLRSLDPRQVTGLGLIRELLERQRLAQEDREGIDAARRNEVFHPAIRDAAHNGFLINSIEGLRVPGAAQKGRRGHVGAHRSGGSEAWGDP
ncbi:MAG: hypothetical protein AAF160_19840 [Pseudomonadota bacterium]